MRFACRATEIDALTTLETHFPVDSGREICGLGMTQDAVAGNCLTRMGRTTLIMMAGLLGATVAWAASSSLVKDSPFIPAVAMGDVPTVSPLELRGVLAYGRETFLRLSDPSSGLAMWVGIKEAGHPFVVQDYDADKCVAKVVYKGLSLTLTLKQAKVVAMELPQLPEAAEPSAGAVSANTSEADGMEAIINEIRRGRALRAQAALIAAPRPPARQPNRN